MKKFYSIIFVFLFIQLCAQAQFNVCPTGTYTRGVIYTYAVDDQIYWASRRDVTGTIVTTDGGNTWTLGSFTDPKGYPVMCIHAFDANSAFVTASTIYKTTDRGTTWTAATGVFNNTSSFVNTIHFFDQNNGVAMGDPVDGYFEIYTTTNGGVNWVRVPSNNIPAPLPGETGYANTHAYYNNSYWFTASNGRIFRSTDRGYTWTCYQLFPQATGIGSIAFRDELHGLSECFIGSNWYYYNTSDGGSTWTYVSSWPSWMYGYYNYVSIPGSQSIYTINSISYSGNELKAMVLFTNDDGMTWHRMDDWGSFTAGDFVDFGQWTSVNSGWGSFYSANQGNIYHWPGYTGKHIWRAASSIKFGNQAVGEIGDTFGISIGNYGTLPTTINALSLSSTNFSLVNPPSLPIIFQPWNAVDISISFTSHIRGLLNDSLVINSDAANYSSLSVNLKGKALQFTAPSSNFIYAASESLFTFTHLNLTTNPIGGFDGVKIEGLTIRPADSVLIGISTNADSSILYKIDPIVGGCLPVITIHIGNIRAIAYTSSGTLFAGQKSGALYKVNANTGEATLIGTSSKSYSAFAFNLQDGKLYASVSPAIGASKDAIYTVDTLTAAVTLLGLTGDGKGTPSISFSVNGTLYGLEGTGSEINKLISISTVNGSGTEIGTLGKSGLQAIIASQIITDIEDENNGMELSSYELFQNYPNPFNPTTSITYTLKENIPAKLTLLNVLGEELAVLVNEQQDKGYNKVEFDGSKLSSGVYFYRLKAGNFIDTKKMILLR